MSDYILLKLEDLAPLRELTENFCRMGNDYIMCRMSSNSHFKSPKGHSRFSGLAFCLVTRGSTVGEIDTQPIELKEGSLLVFSRWNSLLFNPIDKTDIQAEMLFVSDTFIQDINIDLNALDMHSLFDKKPRPVMDSLSPTAQEFIMRIFDILRINAEKGGETVYTRNIGRSALQCLVYLLLQVHATRVSQEPKTTASVSRQVGYTQEFMQLLQLHHTRHRNIGFYADRMHISPKYLSHIIKEATGKSASDWIGEFVVREAKNMLRFTNKNVQQVAYALNFSTQSSFGKFFKHITGMSPSEFQKT